ncbi:peroxisomal sarcosine oxidase isoform X1 [Octopus bimaculoides]|uniref:peroxisomal sarcosine oxidase isoform X1 n=1 Tax=Octopus bimaculoides TaxID=37653 RepID=UPI00071DA13C|nr:peroxisomal sarcosine oxidase isoform X1 [Octopus bimaculoides]|eukprot:XP_014786226.1 PREDICTED: peroxisomal sarcosine oxidase-like [Octopus bimaculoides]
MAAVYDAIVVGAGINGSSTAHYLQKNGYRTLLLEQFPLPHSRGSSHGQSRITRKAYFQEIFAEMMKEAYPMWAQLERDSETQLYKKSQLLVMSTPQSSYMDTVKRVLIDKKMTFKDVPADRLLKEFNIKVPAGSKALIEPEGGILRADQALMTFQNQFKKLGGKIIDGTPVLSVEPGEIIKLHTTKGMFQSRNVVLCQGSWAKIFFNQLGIDFPLKPMKISVGYFKSKVPGQYELKNNFPAFYYGNGIDEFYGLPAEEYPGMLKLFLHHGPEIDPNKRDQVDSRYTIEKCEQLVKDIFPGLELHPSIIETCIYTMTPDEQFVLDRHPKFPNLILGAGFSGHGFKLAPVTGKILGEMVMNKRPSYDMSHFRLDRFSRKSLL